MMVLHEILAGGTCLHDCSRRRFCMRCRNPMKLSLMCAAVVAARDGHACRASLRISQALPIHGFSCGLATPDGSACAVAVAARAVGEGVLAGCRGRRQYRIFEGLSASFLFPAR